jgi:hypothetical protein
MLKEMTADSIRDAAVNKSTQKMRSILVDGLQKVLEGNTTVREVLGGASEVAEDAAKKAAINRDLPEGVSPAFHADENRMRPSPLGRGFPKGQVRG